MTRHVDAIFENGLLRPIPRLDGIAERARVKLRIDVPDEPPSLLVDCLGILPDDDAAEMLGIIDTEFERVDPDDWK